MVTERPTSTQESFDPDDYGGREEAKAARDARYKELIEWNKKYGGNRPVILRRWVLKNQMRGYSGFGTAKDTSLRDVFMLNIINKEIKFYAHK